MEQATRVLHGLKEIQIQPISLKRKLEQVQGWQSD